MSLKKLSLGDLCTITKGTTGIQRAVPGEYPMVVTGEERKSHNEYQFDDEAVIVPLVSGTGHGHASIKRIHYQAGKFALGSILCAIIPKDKTVLNTEYLFRFLDLNRENELVARMKGMANVSLPIKEIARIEIPVPDLNEQIKFVKQYKILEQSSWKIDTELNHQLNLVKQLRQSFLREAMQGKLTIRQSGSEENQRTGQQLLEKIKVEKAQLIKDKKLKKEKELPPIKPEEIPFEIPENWAWCRLGEVSYDITYGTSEKAAETGDIPILRMGNITLDGRILYSNLKYVSENIVDLPKLYLECGDMVFNRTNSYELVGKTGVFDNEDTYTFASYLIRVRFHLEVNSRFISSYINSSICRKTQLEPQIIQQNGQANFNGTKLSNIVIPIPPICVQNQIVKKLDGFMQKCDELEVSIKRSQQQNEQLLQKVLREALEVEKIEASEERVKIIKLPTLQPEEVIYYQKRKALATYILNQSLSDPWLGDTKLMKLLHLADYHAIKRNLGQKFYQKAAGPFDNGFIYPFFEEIERDGWFKRVKRDGRFYFSPGANHNQSSQMDAYFSEEELGAVDQIIAHFKKDNYERPEIISTLYAVWNNRIINGVEVSDALLKQDFLDWDAQKVKYKRRLDTEIRWMRDKGIVPDGWGKLIDKPKALKLL